MHVRYDGRGARAKALLGAQDLGAELSARRCLDSPLQRGAEVQVGKKTIWRCS